MGAIGSSRNPYVLQPIRPPAEVQSFSLSASGGFRVADGTQFVGRWSPPDGLRARIRSVRFACSGEFPAGGPGWQGMVQLSIDGQSTGYAIGTETVAIGPGGVALPIPDGVVLGPGDCLEACVYPTGQTISLVNPSFSIGWTPE